MKQKITLFIILFFYNSSLHAQIDSFTLNYYVCQGECILLDPIETGNNLCYAWYPSNQFDIPQQETQEVCPAEDIIYTLFITNDNGDLIKKLFYKIHVFDLITLVPNETDSLSRNSSVDYACEIAQKINEFLTNNDIYEQAIQDASLAFKDIGLKNIFTLSHFFSFVDAFDVYFEAPEEEENINNLLNYFNDNQLDLFVSDPSNIKFPRAMLELAPIPIFNWENMTGEVFISATQSLKDYLLGEYPLQISRIIAFWACRILGPAQEEAVLNALGLIQDNTDPNNGGFLKRPDGYIVRPFEVIDGSAIYEQPFFIEVKGRYSETAAPVFNWSNGPNSQFLKYREYLKNPTNTQFPDESVMHGLYLILPAGVTLNNSIILLCSEDNIPLYLSYIEYNTNMPNEIRVTPAKLLNLASLNTFRHYFRFLPDILFKDGLERNLMSNFDYDTASINFQHWADIFEVSFLQTNTDPNDTCEDH